MTDYTMPFLATPHARQLQSGLSIAAGSKIVMIGTSLTDNGYQDASESASTVGHTARGADSWTRVLTNQQFDWVNAGVAGNNIQNIIDRFDTDVAIHNPDVVIFDAGTNDAGATESTIIAQLQILYAKAAAIGAIAVPLTIAMRGAGLWTTLVREKIIRVNNWIKANYPTAIEINTYFTNPQTGFPYDGYTDDGTHWSNLGGYAIARSIAENITISGYRNPFETAINNNPDLTGTNGSSDVGITGTMPSGYHFDIISGTPTATTTTNENGLTMTLTPSGVSGTDKFSLRTNPLNVTTAFNTAYELLAKIQASHWDGWRYIQLRLNQPGNSSSYDLYQIMNDALYPYPPEAFLTEKILKTAPLMTNGTTNYTRLYLEIGIDGLANGAGILSLNQFQLQNSD